MELFPVKGYEGLYAITKDARIWSYAKGTYPSRWLNPIVDNLGYPRTTLTKGKVAKIIHVHRLVAINFIPNPDNLPQVNHINGIKTDNRIENLEWCTALGNSLHAHRILGHKNSAKQREVASYWGKQNAKPIVQYSLNGDFIKLFNSTKDAGDHLGICRTGITSCLNRRRKTAGGYRWKFA